MKRFFTVLMALALIISAVNAQHTQRQRINVAQANPIEGGIVQSNDQVAPSLSRAPGDVTFLQDFESASFPPTGWTLYGTNFQRYATGGHNGAGCFGYGAGSSSFPVYGITTQSFTVGAGTYFSFWAKHGSLYTASASYYTAYRIKVSTTNNAQASFTTIKEYSNFAYTGIFSNNVIYSGINNWYEMTADLSAYAGQTIYVAIEVLDHYGDDDIRIDDVKAYELLENDLRIIAGGYYTQIPLSQTLPTMSAKALNAGTATQTNVVFEAKLNGTSLGTSTPIASLASGATSADLTVTPAAVNTPAGNNTLAYSVTSTQGSTGSTSISFTGTPTTFATDDGVTFNTFYGSSSANVSYGNVYTFTQPSTICQVEMYLYTGSTAIPAHAFTLSVYPMTGPTTINPTAVITTTVNRTTGTYWHVQNVTPTLVQAGSYFVCVTETTTARISGVLGSTSVAGGYAFTRSGNNLTPISGNLFIRLKVDLPNNDLKLLDAAFPYTKIPSAQAALLPFPNLTAKAQNLGLTAQTNVVFSAKYNNVSIGSSTPLTSLAALTTSAALNITPNAGTVFPTALGNNSVEYIITQNETDANPADNSATFNFEITDNLYALDGVTDINGGGVGVGAAGARMGMPFTITKAVNLTKVTIGFMASTAQDYNIMLYNKTGATAIAATPLFTKQAVRPTAAGFVTVDVPTTFLMPGDYYLCVQEITATNIGVLYDSFTGRNCYYITTGTGTTLTATNQFGAVAIRMVTAPLPGNDAAITAITAPVDGVNLTNETVTATIKNFGNDPITACNLELTVDGVVVATEPYTGNIASGATDNYTFTATANLTNNGDHTIKVRVILTGDTNPDNDSFTKTVNNIVCGVLSLPATQNFTTNSYKCWTMISNNPANGYNGTGTAPTMGVTAISSINTFVFSSATTVTGTDPERFFQYFISPELETSSKSLEFAFDYARSATTGTTTFRIGYSSTTNAVADFTWGTTITVSSTASTFNNGVWLLPAGTKYVAINYNVTASATTRLYVRNISIKAAKDNDAAITAITAPVSGNNLSNEIVTATIKNNGAIPITVCVLDLIVDGAVVATETFNGNIAWNTTANYTFTATANLSAAGNHTVAVKAFLPNDEDVTNNSFSIIVNNIVCPVVTLPLVQDFSSPLGVCWGQLSNNAVNGIGGTGTYPMGIVTLADGLPAYQFSSYTSATGTNAYYQYLITPELPATSNSLKISFDYARSSTSGTESFIVGYSTTTNATAAFTWVGTATSVTNTYPAFTNKTVTIPAGAKYIAINYRSNYQYMLYIRNVYVDEVRQNDAAITAITAPVAESMDFTANETVTAKIKNNGENPITTCVLELAVDGVSVATETFNGNLLSAASADYTFNAKANLSAYGNHTISVRVILANDENPANNTFTKVVNHIECSNITSFPWMESFENGIPVCWKNIDADGDGHKWEYMPQYGIAASYSYDNPTYSALTPDNWLISPKLVLGNGEYSLSFMVGGLDASYYAETYSVLVSTTGTNISDFTEIYNETLASVDIHEVTLPLNNYSGQAIYIAFRHWNSTDEFVIVLFDVAVDIAPVNLSVVSTTPANNAIDVTINAPVSVTFDNDITANNLTGITISPSVSGVSASVNGAVLTIAHGNFANNTSYTVTVPAGAINGYNQAITWSFKTVAEPLPLAVVSTTPANGATNVNIDAEVLVTFNKEITANNLSGVTINGIAASATVVEDKLIISHSNFANNASYTVVVYPNTISGYAETLFWSFTTAAGTGVPVVNGNEINIFQNNGEINIIVSEKSDIRVLDMLGRVLANYNNVEANATLKVHQPAGIYMLEVRSNGGVSTHKVIVK